MRTNPTNAYVLHALAYLTALRVDTGLQIEELVRTTMEGQLSPNTRCVMLDALLLSGNLVKARQTVESFLREGVGDPYRLILRYVAGHLNEDECRERFRAQSMLCLDGDADYCVALVKLAERDRMRALEGFQSCVDRHVFASTWYWWAKAFVGRILRDHSWPEWIKQTRTVE